MSFAYLLLISTGAGACTALGAVLLFIKKNWSNRSLAVFLGLASGVMVGVVVFDLIPSFLFFPGWVKGVYGILAGLFLLFLLEHFLLRNLMPKQTLVGLGYLIMLGIAMHDFPEGMAIALGHEMKARTGLVIALAIGIHNIPEGMAIAAPLIMAGLSRIKILIQALLVGIITPLGTIIGRATVLLLPGILPFLLGLASGIMLYLVIYQLWPQANLKGKKEKWKGFWLGIFIILLATFL
ncbi:zinc transporter, ZIP family [Thermosyntropha lipolytica DSM 11003]|uniref:Zinc transporter, ZIP family n=1 Tax=Thermosyntropha lipolytica DSM 11003 TaxID=1123382 RepID=A0A1M5PEI9_9FIRM|nr:ZIP family metal transporter [Thermosyntropha lipolytica]SHH00172.1 zinc transporter, ZIP family [Thermosyntropha lipolytica DSM 11003]